MEKGKSRLKQSNIIPVDKYISFLLNTDKLSPQDVKCLRYKVRNWVALCKQNERDVLNGPLC